MSEYFRFDLLTAVMLALIVGVALAIAAYARRYLAGAARPVHAGWFLAVIGAVVLLVTTNHLLVLALAWTASSVALHQLLTFFPDRPQAVIAAHKKFLLSRFADAAILSAVVLLGTTLGTYAIDGVLVRARELATIPWTLQLAGVLLVIGVLLRSAQLPFHGWLIQVMEAPTPISALLHAGIVNIGGFVLIRLSPLMVRLEAAQTLLVLAGLATVLLAALVMLTRVSVKVALAWSTAGQMGFMLLECGLGAYDLALLHLVAHGCYKAHAFLASGGAVERHVRRGPLPAPSPASRRLWLAGGAAGVTVVALAFQLLGLPFDTNPGYAPLGLVLGLALAPLAVHAAQAGGWRAMLGALGIAVGLVGAAAGWHLLLSGLLPVTGGSSEAMLLRSGLAAAGFLGLFLVQAELSAAPSGRLARRLHPACYAGFYLDEIFTRLTFRLWPPRPVPTRSVPGSRTSSMTLERAA